MAVFTRYAKVIESGGSPMTVRTALGIINQTLDEVLTEQEGEFDSDTRWALAWFEQFGMEEGPFGDAETLSKAKNTAINGLVEAGIVVAHAGKVRAFFAARNSRGLEPGDRQSASRSGEVTQHAIRTARQTRRNRGPPLSFNNSAASRRAPATSPTAIRQVNVRSGPEEAPGF